MMEKSDIAIHAAVIFVCVGIGIGASIGMLSLAHKSVVVACIGLLWGAFFCGGILGASIKWLVYNLRKPGKREYDPALDPEVKPENEKFAPLPEAHVPKKAHFDLYTELSKLALGTEKLEYLEKVIPKRKIHLTQKEMNLVLEQFYSASHKQHALELLQPCVSGSKKKTNKDSTTSPLVRITIPQLGTDSRTSRNTTGEP